MVASDGFSNLRMLWPYLHNDRKRILYGTGLMLLGCLLVFPMPFMTMYLIDHVLTSGNPRRLYLLASVGMGVLGLKWLVDYLERLLWARINEDVIVQLCTALLLKLQKVHISALHEHGQGYLTSRLVDDPGYVRGLLADTALELIRELIILITSIVAMIALNWRLALACLFCLPWFVISMKHFNWKLRKAAFSAMEHEATVRSEAQGAIVGMETYRLLTAEETQLKRFVATLHCRYEALIRRTRMAAITSGTNSMIASLGPLAVIIYGGHCVMSGQLTVGGLMAFSALLNNTLGPSARLVASNSQIQNSLPALARIREIQGLPEEERPLRNSLPALNNGHLVLQDLAFHHEGNRPFSLTIPYLEIQPGEWVSIVGENGSGKSTLARLLVRILEPTEGRILLDGIDISKMCPTALRKVVGALLQDPFLFNGSVEDNIRLGRPDATNREVHEAAKIAGLDSFVSSLPSGYSTLLSEGGRNLSQGQRQRISIARLVLRNPPVVVLDEPTANVDRESEEAIIRTLRKVCQHRTTLIISHGETLLNHVDRVIRLKDGAILEDAYVSLS